MIVAPLGVCFFARALMKQINANALVTCRYNDFMQEIILMMHLLFMLVETGTCENNVVVRISHVFAGIILVASTG